MLDQPPHDAAASVDGDAAWRAVLARDVAADDRLVYAVTTTGICCRPSCPSRRPRRDHVRFFPDAATAIAAGFRPCRRCHPERVERLPPAIAAACAHLRQHAERAVTLAELAQVTGLSPSHLQRAFTAHVGSSPKQWHRACRERLLRERLRDGEAVAAAGYGVGYGSGSRLYERATERLGMTPGRYARGGAGVAISWACAATPLGRVLVAATDRGVCSVTIGDDDTVLLADLRREFPAASIMPMPDRGTSQLRAWLRLVVAAVRGDAAAPPPLALHGSDLQLQVWEALRTIPSGETWSYARLAAALGRPGAARAIARACATNRIAVLIPCHRVIRGDGDLAGYRWGLARKAALLARERAAQARPTLTPS